MDLRLFLTTSVLLSCIFCSSCAKLPTHFSDIPPQPPNTIRVANYNLYWKNGFCDETLDVINAINPDILLLQEVTPKWEHCLAKKLRKRYPYYEFKYDNCEGGLAFFSRYPIFGEEYIPPTFGWFPAWLMDIKTPYGRWQFLNVHLRPSIIVGNGVGLFAESVFTAANVRKQEIQYLYTILDPQQSTIIAGDFNENDFGGATRYLRKVGMIDALFHDKQWRVTWRWPTFPVIAGRYDRLYYSRDLYGRNLTILHEGKADHFPVVMDFSPRSFKPRKTHRLTKTHQHRKQIEI